MLLSSDERKSLFSPQLVSGNRNRNLHSQCQVTNDPFGCPVLGTEKHTWSWVTLSSFPSALVGWKSITMNKNKASINFKEFLKLPRCCKVISAYISMGYIKLLFLGLLSLRFTYLLMLKQQTQYWVTEMCWKIYCYFLLSTVFKPLHVGFSHLSPPYFCYFSVLPATVSHSFAPAVWHAGLQQWPPSSPCSCLTSFQSPYRKHASRRLENRSKFFLNAAVAASL